MKIEMGKSYRTKDGREIRIYALDGGGSFPVQGAIENESGWGLMTWAIDGRSSWHDHHELKDLIEVKPRHRRTVWINVYPDSITRFAWNSKEVADREAHVGRLACIRVDLDFEEGEGL